MKKKKNTDKEIDEENEKKVTRRTLWLEARVTEQEYAQGDLIRIAAAVKSIQADKRAMYFSDTRFVEQWMRTATQLINRWSQIENYLTE